MNSGVKESLSKIPHVPGVYLYKDKDGEVIYVGKAKDLKNRVGSYFNISLDPSSKTYALVQHIDTLSYIEVASEFEALILEAELIKKYRPKYNIMLKDDKSYVYIVFRGAIPRVTTARKNTLHPKDTYFGPYPDGRITKNIVKTLRRLIPFRDCDETKFNRYKKLGKPCLYGHIGLCPGVCVFKTQEDSLRYKSSVSKLKDILKGKSKVVVNDYRKRMLAASKAHNFEEAARVRDLLHRFEYVSQSFTSPSDYILNPYLIQDLSDQAITELGSSVPILQSVKLTRIECYDIANISGREAVGSMVVSINGKPDKSEYKRFKIKLKSSPDDFGMLTEVLTRRITRALKGSAGWELPDLFLIDGGKGQVAAITAVLKELGVTVPVLGLAKKFETLVFYNPKPPHNFVELRLPHSNKGLQLLIRLRDEAHRFAQNYHHLLRLKTLNV